MNHGRTTRIALVHAALNLGLAFLFVLHAHGKGVSLLAYPLPGVLMLAVSLLITWRLHHHASVSSPPRLPPLLARFFSLGRTALLIVTLLFALPVCVTFTHTATRYVRERVYEIEHPPGRYSSTTRFESLSGDVLNRREEINNTSLGYVLISGWLAFILFHTRPHSALPNLKPQ